MSAGESEPHKGNAAPTQPNGSGEALPESQEDAGPPHSQAPAASHSQAPTMDLPVEVTTPISSASVPSSSYLAPRSIAEASDDTMPSGNSILGDYQILARLGQGGMALVYLAVKRGPKGFQKLLVLKVLRKSLAADPDLVKQFVNEAVLSARLNHRNVVQTYETVVVEDSHLIVMEYLDGASLARLRRRAASRGNALSAEVHLSILLQALNGLCYAHALTDYDGTALGLIHRDFTPNNVFITCDGQVKVLDFGIAKAASALGETRTATLKGTVPYMAPEAILGERVDQRSDVYAAGVCLWEAATGARMWTGVDDITVMHRVTLGRIPKPREGNPDVPAEIAEICERATHPEPSERYQTASELRDSVEEYLGTTRLRDAEREAGNLVQELFEEDRKEIGRVIETQLDQIRRAQRTGQGNSIPVVSLDSQTTDASVRIPSGSPANAASRRNLGLGIGALALGLGALGAWFVVNPGTEGSVNQPPPGSNGQPPPGTETATTGAAVAGAQAQNSGVGAAVGVLSDQVVLRVEASPATARLFLDNTDLGQNPVVLRLPRQGGTRFLRAEAPGYVTKTERIELTSDVEVVLTLSPRATTRRPRTKRIETVTPPPPPPPMVEGSSSMRRGLSLDRNTPWD